MLEAIATLVAGGIIGYFGQRSRICFVGGIRDWLLVRDTELLKGLAIFVVTSWVGFSVLASFDWITVRPFDGLTEVVDDLSLSASIDSFQAVFAGSLILLLITVSAAFVLGFLSVLAEGCPLRQHVRAGQGDARAWSYIAGFYVGVLLAAPALVIITRTLAS